MTERGWQVPATITLDTSGRIIEPEGKTREYKRDLSSPARPLRTIVAFANSAGGQLAIGVADDGTVVGVADPLAEEERIASLIADSISPQLVPAIDLVTVGDATVLVVDVPLSTRRPHYITSQGIGGGVYVRLGSTTRQADPALVAELERTARGVAFEDLPEPRATLDDLDLPALPPIGGRAITETDLVPLGLAVRDGDKLVPTNAGLLAASPHPDRFLPSAWVQCGRIRGENRTDIFDQIEFHGSLLRAPDEVLDFLRKHAFVSAEFGAARRRDVSSIPIEPIREIVVNAIVHASYAERGTPIRVVFYDDRIEIEGPGLLVAGMTVEGMRNASRMRNPSLARIFRAAGLMENFGTGVRRVYEQLAEAGLPEPRIEEVVDRVRFTVYVPSHAPGGPTRERPGRDKAPRSERGDSLSHKDLSLSHQEVTMLTLVLDQPVNRVELLQAIGVGNETRNFRRHIAPLLDAGLLERTVPDRPTSRHQQYRVTAEGRALLNEARESL